MEAEHWVWADDGVDDDGSDDGFRCVGAGYAATLYGGTGRLVAVAVLLTAIDLGLAAKELLDGRDVHERVVVVIGTVAGPDFFAWLNVARCDERKVGVGAEPLTFGVLKTSGDAVYLAGSKIKTAYVATMLFAVNVFIRVSFLVSAIGDAGDVVVVEVGIIVVHQDAAQLSDHFS